MKSGPRVLRLATRGSPLALGQSARVAELVSRVSPSTRCEMVIVQTAGDASGDTPIASIGGQGAFVKEVSAAVIDGRADIAVHSAKDLQSLSTPGLVLAAVPERLDPRDVLVGRSLGDLPPGSVVATGSARRRAQLAWLRPDLTFSELRGNMARRLERAEAAGCGVLAAAALERLGLVSRIAEFLDVSVMVPQVGQGALAVECLSSEHELVDLLAATDDQVAHTALVAERAFLSQLGGGCSLPCGAIATPWGSLMPGATVHGGLVIEGVLASRDGHVLLRRTVSGDDPTELGRALAVELLDSAGGRSIEDWADAVSLPSPSSSSG